MRDLLKKFLRKVKIVMLSFFSTQIAWLYKNRLERMDANRNDIFEFSRTAFHLDRYKFAAKFSKDKIVLDAACGTGYGSMLLLEEGEAKKVIGLDSDFITVNYSKENYSDHNINFINASITALPFSDESFDLVVSFETIEHVIQENEMLAELRRVLKGNGKLILSTPNDWGLGELAPFHVRSYNFEQVRQSLLNYFEIKQVYNQNSGTKERKENHDQPRGIIVTNDQNYRLAECYIVIAEKNNPK